MGAPVAANGLNANTAVSGANGSARRQSLLVTSCLAAAGVAAAFVAVYPSSALANCPSTTINANASVTQAWATCSLINNATISVGAGPGVTVTGSVLGALTNNGSIGGADAILFGSGVSAGTINNTSTIGPSSGSGISISSATLGALTNSGQIVAPNAGVTLGGGGAITSIANTSSGTIIGSLTAIVVNGGTLGALSNTGSISGSVGVGLKSGGISSIVNGVTSRFVRQNTQTGTNKEQMARGHLGRRREGVGLAAAARNRSGYCQACVAPCSALLGTRWISRRRPIAAA